MEFRSVDDPAAALEALATLGSDARILAGGTDLVLQLKRGQLSAPVLLHVGRLVELGALTADDEGLALGALVTHRRLATDATVATTHRALAEAAATVGGWQTQAVGTVGGNVCNASPAADTVPALLVADAEVRLASTRGERRMALEAFVVGRRDVARDDDELLTGLRLPAPPPRTGEVYLKVAPRRAMEVALVGLAVRLTLGADDDVSDARIAACAVGPRPFRARAAEAALVAGGGREASLREAGALLAEQAAPIDDARATARYRRRVLPALLARAVATCHERAAAAA